MTRRVFARTAIAALLATCAVAVTVRFSVALQPNDPDWPYQLDAGAGVLDLRVPGTSARACRAFSCGLRRRRHPVVDLAGRVDPGVNYATSDTATRRQRRARHDGCGDYRRGTDDQSLTAGAASRVHIVPVKVCRTPCVRGLQSRLDQAAEVGVPPEPRGTPHSSRQHELRRQRDRSRNRILAPDAR